jgi:oligopeptide transport system substrate-binding protein
MRQWRLAGLSALILVFAGAATAAPKEGTEHVLRVRTLGDPLTLDWNRAFTPVESILVRNLMEGLVAIGPKMKVEPALARKWTVNPGGTIYTFQLRDDVVWSDGAPLKAQQFVDSWKRLLSPEFQASYAYLLFDIVNAEAFHTGKISDFKEVGVKALDDHTLQVKLRAPVAYWLWIPTFWCTFPIRQDIISRVGFNWDKPGYMINLGPYLLDSYEPHRNVVLKRNPRYYGKRGNVERIVSALIEDESTAIRMYYDNQLDFMTRLSVEAAHLHGRTDFKQWPEARIAHLDFNPNQEPTSDVRLRRAIAMAIDKTKLARLLEGASAPASTFVPPGIMGYAKQGGLAYDPKKAHAIMEEAGYYKKALPTLELVVAGYNDEVLAANFIAEELKNNLGLNVQITKYEPKQFYSPMVSFGGFAMLLNRWTADFPDPDNFYSIFLAGAGNNRVGWKNSKYDELVVAARGLSDAKLRAQAYAKANRLLTENDAVAVPLYYGRNCALIRPGIKGFEPTPTNSYLFKDFSIR